MTPVSTAQLATNVAIILKHKAGMGIYKGVQLKGSNITAGTMPRSSYSINVVPE